MRIVTNPGSNLSPAAVERYDVHVAPQQIIVDGEAHDTRDGISFDVIDGWVRTAKVHPYVVGTTAAEFVAMFRELSVSDREILAVMTSRRIIGSHDAAVSAGRTLASHPGSEDVRVAVADSGVTDVGAGLATILAGESRRAGRSLDETAKLVDAYRRHVRFAFLPATLDYLVKGGRATALRAFMADLLRVRPIVGFVDGEVKPLTKVATKIDPAISLSTYVVKELREGRPAWIAVCHGGDPALAEALELELRKRLDVRFAYSRPLSPSIYLHGGPGSLSCAAVPIDALPWQPPTPPRL